MVKKNNRFVFVTSSQASQKSLIVIATGLLLSACSYIPAERPADIHIQPEYSQIKQEVSKQIRKLMRKHRIKGVSIALIDDQKTVWAQGFGYADVEKKYWRRRARYIEWVPYRNCLPPPPPCNWRNAEE